MAVAAAAAYDPEGSYAVGDYCTHGGKLHKCSTPIPSGEPWTVAHWTETTVAAELANRLSLSGGMMMGAITWPHEQYFGPGAESSQLDWKSGICSIRLIPENANGMDISKCVVIRNTVNGDLSPIATATPPQEHEVSFRSGWSSAAAKSTYYKTQEGSCVVNCAVYGTGAANDNFIATLPAGFRPNATVCRAAHAYKGSIRGIAEAQIAANGDIVIYSPIEFDYVSFGATFLARN